MVLAGSSSMWMWEKDAKRIFPYKVINKAIRGSTVVDWLKIYKRRIIKPHPDIILFYCGANDIQDGNGTPGPINAANTKKLLIKIHKKLPSAKIFYISINHCNRNPGAWKEIDISNAALESFCSSRNNIYYIDILTPSLIDGLPNPILFRADQLHPSREGFEIWNRVIGNYVKRRCK